MRRRNASLYKNSSPASQPLIYPNEIYFGLSHLGNPNCGIKLSSVVSDDSVDQHVTLEGRFRANTRYLLLLNQRSRFGDRDEDISVPAKPLAHSPSHRLQNDLFNLRYWMRPMEHDSTFFLLRKNYRRSSRVNGHESRIFHSGKEGSPVQWFRGILLDTCWKETSQNLDALGF